jgi:ABC-type Fe3+/spermidine/putrescine transport system ATPase subunit
MAETVQVSAVATQLPCAGPLLEIRSVNKSFGGRVVLREISLAVTQGEFLTILGESGSGKTTLLRLIAGFEPPDAGEIWMGGERLDPLPPFRRRVNTVFQHYALFPHLSVFENVAYGLRAQKAPRLEIPRRVEDALAMVKMTEFTRHPPGRLSGGQQQRVALARALVNRPKLLLLDEPLSALDANLRRQMRLELKALQREVGISFVFVTHDQEEAMALSDRIALLHAGELEQVASPREIYDRPVTTYTAQFIGQTNLLEAEVRGGIARCGDLAWRCGSPDGHATFSLRPECIRIARTTEGPHGEAVRFRATVQTQAFGGATNTLQLRCPDGRVLLATISGREGQLEDGPFEFLATDAVRLRDAQEG